MSLWTLKLIKIEFYDLNGIVNIQLLIDFLLDRYYNTFDIFLNSFSPDRSTQSKKSRPI